MAVVIVNVTKGDKLYDDTADHDYELRINTKHIVDFTHRRDEGLAVCLRRAADAMDKAEIPVYSKPFRKEYPH